MKNLIDKTVSAADINKDTKTVSINGTDYPYYFGIDPNALMYKVVQVTKDNHVILQRS